MNLQDSARVVRLLIVLALVIILGTIAVFWMRKSPSLVAGQNAQSAYRPIICDNAFSTEAHYEKRNPQYIDVKLAPGCFSGFVALPEKWRDWQGQMLGDNAGDWVAEWYSGWTQPRGPWSATQINSGVVHFTDNNSYKLRTEGQGTLRIYRITGDETPTREDVGSTPSVAPSDTGASGVGAPPIERKPAPPCKSDDGSDPVAQDGDLTVKILKCYVAGNQLNFSGVLQWNGTDAKGIYFEKFVISNASDGTMYEVQSSAMGSNNNGSFGRGYAGLNGIQPGILVPWNFSAGTVRRDSPPGVIDFIMVGHNHADLLFKVKVESTQ